jgi:hypothetical protein
VQGQSQIVETLLRKSKILPSIISWLTCRWKRCRLHIVCRGVLPIQFNLQNILIFVKLNKHFQTDITRQSQGISFLVEQSVIVKQNSSNTNIAWWWSTNYRGSFYWDKIIWRETTEIQICMSTQLQNWIQGRQLQAYQIRISWQFQVSSFCQAFKKHAVVTIRSIIVTIIHKRASIILNSFSCISNCVRACLEFPL